MIINGTKHCINAGLKRNYLAQQRTKIPEK
jgi:hypothetical protein